MDTTWKDKIDTAEFSATDRLYQMDGIYEEGIYRADGISAYDQLADVFLKAGLEKDEYSIDPYLKTVILHNPMPKDTYANCILLIANACRCVMKQDRNYKIIIKASFTPELTTSSNAEAQYSSSTRLLEKVDITEYFDWQQSFNRIDGGLFFPPEGEKYEYAGYVSKVISDENGFFTDNPVISLQASAAFTFFQLTIQFGNVFPQNAIIRCFNNGSETEQFATNISSRKHIINHSFMNVDKVQIEFTKASAYNRIHVHYISVEETSDFVFERDDLLEEPTTERQSSIKDIIAIRSVYSLPAEQEDVFSDTVTISDNSKQFKIEFNDASIPVSVQTVILASGEEGSEDQIVNYGAEIVRYSNWYCIIKFNNPPKIATEVELKIKGYIYKVSKSNYILNINTTGVTPDALDNPLIDSVDLAAKYTEWCAKYYMATAEYNLSNVLGDPVVESNDLAYLEREDGKLQGIRVHTVDIKFSGTFDGSSYKGRSAS